MRKTLVAVLALFLCLWLTACTPMGEEVPTPVPTPVMTPMVEPTPVPAPGPTFWGGEKVSSAHYWSNDGYSYTSEVLGITLRFPPGWQWYFTFEEEVKKVTLRSDAGNRIEVESTCLQLIPTKFDLDGESRPFAQIILVPKGMSYDGDSGAWLTLAETEKGCYVCYMDTMLMMWYEPGISADGAKYAIINEVQGGIMDGRWEIELLEK